MPTSGFAGRLRCGRGQVRTSGGVPRDRKSTRLNSSHQIISYAVFCLKKKNKQLLKQIRHVLDPPKAKPDGNHLPFSIFLLILIFILSAPGLLAQDDTSGNDYPCDTSS